MLRKYQKGQIVLIVLLIMVVGLTMGLAVISRSVTNIKMSTQTEQSQRAFSAAEAGIEEYLRLGVTPAPQSIGGANFTVSKSNVGGGTSPYIIRDVARDDTQTVWLAAHNADGTINETSYYQGATIDLCWGGNNAALEASVFYKDPVALTYKVSRYAIDPDSGRRTSNSFYAPAAGGCGGLNYKYTVNLSALPAGPKILLRLRPVYAQTSVGVVAPVAPGLPTQGSQVESTGQAGETSRKVQVFQSYPVLPPIFDYVLFSGQSLTK